MQGICYLWEANAVPYQCIAACIQVPIIAIGGIQLNDVVPLLEAGAHGIAVSSAIVTAPNKLEIIEAFESEIGDVYPYQKHQTRNN